MQITKVSRVALWPSLLKISANMVIEVILLKYQDAEEKTRVTDWQNTLMLLVAIRYQIVKIRIQEIISILRQPLHLFMYTKNPRLFRHVDYSRMIGVLVEIGIR